MSLRKLRTYAMLYVFAYEYLLMIFFNIIFSFITNVDAKFVNKNDKSVSYIFH